MRATLWLVMCCAALAALGCSKTDPKAGKQAAAEAEAKAAEQELPAPLAEAARAGKPVQPAPPVQPAQPAQPAPTPSQAVAAAQGGAPAPAAAKADDGGDHAGDLVEVEVFGSIKGAPSGTTMSILVAVGDCLADDARVLGRTPAGQSFMIEVFAPWGSDLTVCAAVEPGDGKPAVLYGKWKESLHAEGEGEVMFHDVVIELKKGKPHTFPAAS